MTQPTLERLFQVASPARLALANICGSVHIQRGEDGAIAITAVKHPDTGDAERTQVYLEQTQDGSVVVETRFDGARQFFASGKPCDVDYVVRAPAECHLTVRCVSSQVLVQDLSGQCSIESVSGPIAARSLAGTLALKSVSGHISAEGLTGAASLDTVSGEVRLADCQFTSLASNTLSGNVVAQTPLSSGPYRFKTLSGNVTLDVPPQTRCRVDVSSLSGGFSTTLPATRNAQARRRWSGTVGAPPGAPSGDDASLPQVSLASMSGCLRLGPPSDGGDFEPASTPVFTTAPPPAPPPPPPPPSRQEILDRVARGEMSVDEAVRSLAG